MSEQKYLEEIGQIWNMVKDSFRETLSETAINLWFGDVEIISFENDVLTIGSPGEFKFNTIKDKYIDKIKDQFSEVLGFEIQVNLIFTGSAVTADQVKSQTVGLHQVEKKEDPKAPIMPSYNFEYTFENFIVGNTNKFAHAACVAVANNPATNYNPLFIYGNSGLGKTHLMCAIINRMKANNPNVKIIYTKGEDFTNQMIACLTSKTMDEFRDKYRKCDVLLIDDIQFIAGKISIQEEFFHTFNALFEEKKQIILTSDRPPRDIKTLEDRLKSRFEWGLLADIEPPDLELRIAIIKKKAELVNVDIPDEVLTFLGENLRSNIRQIEGTIKKLGALSFLSGQKVTMDLAKTCLLEILGGAEPVNVTVDKIFSAVFNKYGISREDIVGTKRNKEIATARHISIYLVRQITEISLPNIGKIFNRDHATILASIRAVEKRLNTETGFHLELSDLKKDITG